MLFSMLIIDLKELIMLFVTISFNLAFNYASLECQPLLFTLLKFLFFLLPVLSVFHHLLHVSHRFIWAVIVLIALRHPHLSVVFFLFLLQYFK